jgi:Fumarylacetoacetate (FAA) hydrolase family
MSSTSTPRTADMGRILGNGALSVDVAARDKRGSIARARRWIQTKPHAMVARVDDEEWSRGSAHTLHYSVAEIVSYLSRDETLLAGDVIGVGTVGGGCGLELGRYPKRARKPNSKSTNSVCCGTGSSIGEPRSDRMVIRIDRAIVS